MVLGSHQTIQAQFDELSRGWRAQRSLTQMTIAKALDKLGAFESNKLLETPLGSLASYRGHYADLAISSGDEIKTVGNLVQAIQAALGQTYEGYKGGDFFMDEHTPLWFAEYGCCGPRIMDFVVHGPVVRMITAEDNT